MASNSIAYDRAELRGIIKAFGAMDDESITAAKRESGALAEYALGAIHKKAYSLRTTRKMAERIASGGKVSKSSKVGEISLGFASQKFSGGGDTRINQGQTGGIGVLAGVEFGSNTYKQFPIWSGKGKNGGSRGWFIYPALRESQPHIISAWESAFSKIIAKWK